MSSYRTGLQQTKCVLIIVLQIALVHRIGSWFLIMAVPIIGAFVWLIFWLHKMDKEEALRDEQHKCTMEMYAMRIQCIKARRSIPLEFQFREDAKP